MTGKYKIEAAHTTNAIRCGYNYFRLVREKDGEKSVFYKPQPDLVESLVSAISAQSNGEEILMTPQHMILHKPHLLFDKSRWMVSCISAENMLNTQITPELTHVIYGENEKEDAQAMWQKLTYFGDKLNALSSCALTHRNGIFRTLCELTELDVHTFENRLQIGIAKSLLSPKETAVWQATYEADLQSNQSATLEKNDFSDEAMKCEQKHATSMHSLI